MSNECTQRAYTLRLHGGNSSWRNALWETHVAVNRGVKAFGDWLLTLRGGLDHQLANAQTDEERKQRRILLALSWLSVESELGSPPEYRIASSTDDKQKVVEAFEEVLRSRGIEEKEIDEWKRDCSPSLCAPIRDDAVWINRSKAFDDAVDQINQSGDLFTREQVWDMLGVFFKDEDAYLAPLEISENGSLGINQKSEAKDLVKGAGIWLSRRFGKGEGVDFSRLEESYNKIAEWAKNAPGGKGGPDTIAELASELSAQTNDLAGVCKLIARPGRSSGTRQLLEKINAEKFTVTKETLDKLNETASKEASNCKEKINSKGNRQYSNVILEEVESACGITYSKPTNKSRSRHWEFAVMLDHAARRVSMTHTWIKRAEALRRQFESDAQKIENVPEEARLWLDEFCSERSEASGALKSYHIQQQAVKGWKDVVEAWSKCKSYDDRVAAVRELQANLEIEFGDVQLFEALAEDDAKCVWCKDDIPNSQLLLDYVSAKEAESKRERFKIPAYRHPHELLHPVFCDFGNSRWSIEFAVQQGQQSSDHKVTMTLWTGKSMDEVELEWKSKRLVHDLALGNGTKNTGSIVEVTRADRLGRAAANATETDAVEVLRVFKEKHWNGRLQAPREQLEAIHRYVEKHGWNKNAERMRNTIKWQITFSPRFEPKGPWHEYVENHRKERSRLILSRLPGLRLLSVDLGLRYTAACAIWETLSKEDFEKEIQGRTILYGGTNETDLYCHVEGEARDGEKYRSVTIYRRIGPDKLSDDTVHPAPWARLDRQFLIKLQGEEREAREASNEEIWKVHEMEVKFGLSLPLIDRLVASGWGRTKKQEERLEALRKLGWKSNNNGLNENKSVLSKPYLGIDKLMHSTIQTMQSALKRHGDRARIAHYLLTDVRINPGGKKESLDENGRVELIQKALLCWHDLFSSPKWHDEMAKRLWDNHIAVLPGYVSLDEIGGDTSKADHKTKRKANHERFHGPAEELAKNEELRRELYSEWKKRWEEDDKWWKEQLHWVKRWIFPRGKITNTPAIRNVGGISLLRLETLTEFRRKVQVRFFTRLRPDGTYEECKDHFGQRTLRSLDRLYEQRSKQLASHIVEAALGIGRTKGKDRPYDRPCHAIVIENLTNYRPSKTRGRRENRQLMVWRPRTAGKYLDEECQLYGLYFYEVPAGYTSRQDSRTGAPGVRCQDVPVSVFMQSSYWRKKVKSAKEKKNKGDALERFLCELDRKWENESVDTWRKAGCVRIPAKGGGIFISTKPRPQKTGDTKTGSTTSSIQADLNAAANIGLQALIDPDWPGRWWYVPCDSDTFKPLASKVGGNKAVRTDRALRTQSISVASGELEQKKQKKEGTSERKTVINLWRNVSSSPLEDLEVGEWEEFASYWNKVQKNVIEQLKKSVDRSDTRQVMSGNE